MKPQDFCTWLQGYIELGGSTPDEAQWEMIKEHLQLVFKKETSSFKDIKKVIEESREIINPQPYPSWWENDKYFLKPNEGLPLQITC